ncbi:hypothetical protein OUZ56_029824 [Daphnia magna]|uniref:Uncharacterized protein n=1 Tax=Daphnia magna TaxID=35525 RepID=A0ABR0B7Y6_9CRUS|nr:hypothetical protein OUZ56_029824 [Daphnia magna]
MHRPNVKKIDICQSSVVLLQDETPDVRVKMQIIYEYMGSHWFQIVTPDRFSVNGQPRRTTNEVESFHRWFNRRCGIYHQSFWTFIEYLQKVEAGAVKDYNLAGSGRQIRREHSRKQTEKDARGLLADPLDSDYEHSVSDEFLEEDQQGAVVGPGVNRRAAGVRRAGGVRRAAVVRRLADTGRGGRMENVTLFTIIILSLFPVREAWVGFGLFKLSEPATRELELVNLKKEIPGTGFEPESPASHSRLLSIIYLPYTKYKNFKQLISKAHKIQANPFMRQA